MKLEDIISRVEDLPTPDPVVNKIISTASDPEASAKDLADVVRLDPSLASRILRLVNSAYYGLPRKITLINEAVMILGFRTVRNMALSVFTYDSILSRKHTKHLDYFQLWKHFVGVAVGSELLAQMTGYPNKEELFIAGLLHDIGKIALDYVFPEVFESAVKLTSSLKISFCEAEEKLQIPEHAAVGMKLLQTWKLPEVIFLTCGGHHSPENFSESLYSDVISMVHIADFLINLLKYGDSFSYRKPVVEPFTLNTLGIRPKFLVRYSERLKEKLSTVQDFLNIGQEAVK